MHRAGIKSTLMRSHLIIRIFNWNKRNIDGLYTVVNDDRNAITCTNEATVMLGLMKGSILLDHF